MIDLTSYSLRKETTSSQVGPGVRIRAESPLRTQFGQRRLADEIAARPPGGVTRAAVVAGATRLQAMGRKPPHPIRYDCSLSQAGFLACPVQLTGPSNQLTSWSELFPNLGTAARDSEACRGAIQIVRIHFPPGRVCEPSVPLAPEPGVSNSLWGEGECD